MSKGFRDLQVWQLAIDWVPSIYKIANAMPSMELNALGNQLRRAAVSVPTNIAEGQARQYGKEFLQFIYIARGSLAETETLLELAFRLNYIEEAQFNSQLCAIAEIRKMLQGLVAHLRYVNKISEELTTDN